ncbi:plexin-C1-like [Diretmus argenteus]
MRLLLLVWLVAFNRDRGRCRGDAINFTFDGDVRHIAVTNSSVYVATAETLYHLSRGLNLVQSLSQKGTLEGGKPPGEGRFQKVSPGDTSNKTFTVNTLVPFVKDGILISCGVTDCGYCELLDLRNISKLMYKENMQVGSLQPGSRSLGFLVDVETGGRTETYIFTAIQEKTPKCISTSEAVNLQNTNERQTGNIFSFSDGDSDIAVIKHDAALDFVDGFQIGSDVYLFSNIPSAPRSKVRLVWLESKVNKVQTLRSLRGGTLDCCGPDAAAGRLLASSVIPGGPPVLWTGVFSLDGDQASTVLVVFDISPVWIGTGVYRDPDFCGSDCKEPLSQPTSLRPTAVLFSHSNMTSVLAVKLRTWTVLFIGTGDGQLIKLAVDKSYQTACPRVVYRADGDRQVFPKMHLDQVDRKHVYVALRNQLQRVPVSQCRTHKDLEACWSAQDPYCGWCELHGSCTFEDECGDSVWLSVPDDFSQRKMFSYRVQRRNDGQIALTFKIHVSVGGAKSLTNFACHFATSVDELCATGGPAQFPQCTCLLNSRTLPDEGLGVTAKIRLGKMQLKEQLKINNCSNIRGAPTFSLCQQCITSGCGWSSNVCSWASGEAVNDSVCKVSESGLDAKPQISSITPSAVSFYGRNHAVMTGRDLHHVTKVQIQTYFNCHPKDSPVWNNTGVSLTFHIPSGDKGLVKVCVVLRDGSCHGNASITYRSSPSCTMITPNSTWASGKRKITVLGSDLDFVEGIVHSHASNIVRYPTNTNPGNLSYESLLMENMKTSKTGTLSLKVANQTLTCSSITYHPDPEFTSFTSTRTGDVLSVTIQKKADKLEMTTEELSVWGFQGDKKYNCIIEKIETAGLFIYRSQQKKLTDQMNRHIEDLELAVRNDIRQGFVDLQTENAELMENVGAIPFLDYKHFASRIFFPEGGALMTSCLKDIGQDRVKVQSDQSSQALSRLIQDKLFLTSMVHALEEQKSFTVKDKCVLASVLTLCLHGDLFYLTEVMEDLLQALMQQPSNSPKLLLRRTQSTVEKLLTNWMSVCLYGFLRESVGQHLFLLVSALTQHIAKGPVDSVTEKSLYTLSEDWLLWQAPDFTSQKLKVSFAVGSDGEVSEPLEVNALSCDTVEQVKEKILSTFKAKFGFPYNAALRDVRIECEKGGTGVPLEEVDASSKVLGDVTMLNTLKHYEVPDGASIKLLSKNPHPPLNPQTSLKDDQDFSVKYFHLIDPDVEDERTNPERKKLKLKEVHLTKLLSTKVAVHSYVENLFRSIWGPPPPHSRALHAVKYFFDFLDAQAENMKITDPDVLHIWKTNSLPLRFWINILKNPQFVFDMEKTPHLDGCLNVIAQAFMDSFSLSDTQLGKHAPTNKLLYAKDIPKFKQEVKAYYKLIRDQPPISSSEFRDFLLDESKKHDNEFNEPAALRELYKFIQRYFTEIQQKLDQNNAPSELKEQLQHVKNLFDGLKSCSWD